MSFVKILSNNLSLLCFEFAQFSNVIFEFKNQNVKVKHLNVSFNFNWLLFVLILQNSGSPNYIMEQQVNVKDVKILETVEDIQERREQVLKKYVEFKEAARSKREMLEDSRRFQYFRRDADELVNQIEKFREIKKR